MNETPEDPRPPDEGGGDEEPMAQTEPPKEPPYEPVGLPPLSPLGDLPPLDDAVAVTEKRRLPSGRRLVAAGVVVLALVGGGAAVALGGDDGSDDDGGIASVDGSESDGDSEGAAGDGNRPSDQEFEDAMLEYAQCMRDNGVDMPDPEFDGDGGGIAIGGGPGEGPSEETFEKADEACSSIMEEVRGEMTPPSPEEIAEMQDQLVAAAQCMRDKGYDMPDPEVSSDGGVRVEMNDGNGAGGSPQDDETFMEDMEACNEEAGLEGGRLERRPADDGGGS